MKSPRQLDLFAASQLISRLRAKEQRATRNLPMLYRINELILSLQRAVIRSYA